MSGAPRTDSKTLSEAMGQISILLQTEDGVANAAIAEGANRITELERELAGFCREIGEDNPVSAMVELQSMKRELAEAKKDTARLHWLDSVESSKWWQDNGNAVFDIPGLVGELREAIDAAMPLDQWDRDNIDDEINREENQND